MLLSAQYGTGQGNGDERPAHLNCLAVTELECLPTTNVPSVSSISKGLENLLPNAAKASMPVIPIVVVQTPQDNRSKTPTRSLIQNEQLESDGELNQSNEVSLAGLAMLREHSLPRYDRDSLVDEGHNDENDDINAINHEDEEIYYSCEDDCYEDKNNDDARMGSDGTHLSKKTSKDENGYLRLPGLFGIELATDTEFSEDDETEGMKLLAKTPILIKDRKGEIHPIIATIDTGAASSFISNDIVEEYGLKKRPIMKDHIKDFANPISPEMCKPESYVHLPVKSKKIGIDDFIIAKIRVLDGTGFDIIFGRPFIGRHRIFANLSKFDRSGNPFFILIGGRSEGMGVAMYDDDWKTDGATAAQKSRDRAIKEKHRGTALALDRLKDAGSHSKIPPTRSSTGSDTSKSTASWDDASVSWESKESSNTSWATTTDTKNFGDDESLRKF